MKKKTVEILSEVKRTFFQFNYDWQNSFSLEDSSAEPITQEEFYECKINDRNKYDDHAPKISHIRVCEDLNNDNIKVNKIVGVVNWEVHETDLVNCLKGLPDKSRQRRNRLFEVLNAAIKAHVDILVFPEGSIPVEWLPLLMDQSARNNYMIIGGLEYYLKPPIANKKWEASDSRMAYNLLFNIFPISKKYYSAAIPVFRNKNYYSPHEMEVLRGYHMSIPDIKPEYHLIQWRKTYFTTYNCFELSNISDRALFKSKVDFIAAIEFNKDVNYFSNIAESWSRDLHCYVIQSNPSHYGDSRIVEPTSHETRDIVRVKGGKYPIVLVAELAISELRDFNRRDHNLQIADKGKLPGFKPTPAKYEWEWVERRIRNEKITEDPWISEVKK